MEDLRQLERYLPPYLSETSSDELKDLLKNDFPFSNNPHKIYCDLNDISIWYQGDCLFELPFYSLDEKNNPQILYYDGLIISNTCSIDLNNEKITDVFVNFALLYNINDYTEFLKKEGLSNEKVETHIKSIRNNLLSNLMFLPGFNRGKFTFPDSFVRLDKVSSFPISILKNYSYEYHNTGDRIFTFSNYGFYLFLFKLSKNFTRFSEEIDRIGIKLKKNDIDEKGENKIILDKN